MNKPRIRIKNNFETKTVTFLNTSNRYGWQVVANNEIKRSNSFLELFETKRSMFKRLGGVCAKKADSWLDLVKIN